MDVARVLGAFKGLGARIAERKRDSISLFRVGECLNIFIASLEERYKK